MSAPPRVSRWSAATAVVLAASATAADEPAAPDFDAWPCRFCSFESGAGGWLATSGGYVSDPSFHFGDYTGLEDRGRLLDFSGALRRRDAEGGEAWDVHIDRLGLDSRAVGLRGGRQGRYRVWLGYQSLPHLVAADGRTVFSGVAPLSLPPGWTAAGSTGGMSALDSSLGGLWLRQERERTLLGLEFVPRPAADLRLDYRRDEIRGTAATGASFLTLASELPRPVSQTLDRADLSVSLRHALGQAQLGLHSSFFSNDVEALVWQNPYSGPVSGATLGQMAQAPDNRAHRLSLGLGLAPGAPLHASARFAVGRATQDQRFLPATVNPDEPAALPRESLDGRVDTIFASVRASYAVRPGLRASADFLHDDRDNRTPVAAYTQVVMDTFTGDLRRNAPYSSRRERWRVALEQRAPAGVRVAAGVEDETRERRLYDTAGTQERRYWGRLGWRPLEGGHLRLRLSRAEREGDELAAAVVAPQNPLLRAFDTAARERDEARADLSVALTAVTTTFNLSYARDEYPQTVIGRTRGRDLGYGADVALHPVGGLTASGFVSRRLQERQQAGSQAFGAPDWFADEEDATAVLGVQLAWQAPRGLEVGTSYTHAKSEGAIVMAAGGGGDSAYPLLATRWHDARAYARRALRPDLALRLDLVWERYAARDWALDGVAPDTVPNLLSLGRGGGSAEVTAVVLGLRWEFRQAGSGD